MLQVGSASRGLPSRNEKNPMLRDDQNDMLPRRDRQPVPVQRRCPPTPG